MFLRLQSSQLIIKLQLSKIVFKLLAVMKGLGITEDEIPSL